MTDPASKPHVKHFVGISLFTGATLMLEIALTRIFSITMWYHYAFMAISLALFGLSFGAVVVYLKGSWFPREKLDDRLALLAVGQAVTGGVGLALLLWIPFSPTLTVFGLATVLSSFLLALVPFLFSGVAVCLLLTRWPTRSGLLYTFDLVGAALGCLLVLALMSPLTGPGVVLASTFLAATAGLVLAGSKRWRKVAGAICVVLLFLTIIQPFAKPFRFQFVKNVFGLPTAEPVTSEPIVERWNSHAAIAVHKDVSQGAFSWGMSPVYKGDNHPKQLFLFIDAAAGTVFTQWDGKRAEQVQHLRYDITSLAHHLRPESDTLVIGVGGGRDIVTALLFNAPRVTGVEINKDILDLLEYDFADFTGRLARNPKVRFIHDEARSYIERSGERFDIIQASLIDSWAATAAGAFTLTENSLYTQEAWVEFLNHSTDRGVITFSRWWVRERPGEMLRCASLAYAALQKMGIKEPRKHVLIAATEFDEHEGSKTGVGTILISKKPFTAKDLVTFADVMKIYHFTPLHTSEMSDPEDFALVLSPETHESIVANYQLDVTPSTDDKPFFFQTLRFSDIFRTDRQAQWVTSFNMRAVVVLLMCLGMVILLAVGGLLLPLKLASRHHAPLPRFRLLPHSLYFAAIGLGFILVELAAIQRLTIFLGHPVYSLAVVLFGILLATGAGSYLTQRVFIDNEKVRKSALAALGVLFVVQIVLSLTTPSLLGILHGASVPIRLALALGVVGLMGLTLGMGFPIGIGLAAGRVPEQTPWLWAVNGAMSVVGSVLAVVASLAFGITFTAVVGALCYLVAVACAYVSLQQTTEIS